MSGGGRVPCGGDVGVGGRSGCGIGGFSRTQVGRGSVLVLCFVVSHVYCSSGGGVSGGTTSRTPVSEHYNSTSAFQTPQQPSKTSLDPPLQPHTVPRGLQSHHHKAQNSTLPHPNPNSAPSSTNPLHQPHHHPGPPDPATRFSARPRRQRGCRRRLHCVSTVARFRRGVFRPRRNCASRRRSGGR